MGKLEDLIEKVTKLNDEKKYSEVIDILTDAVLEEYKSAELYTEKGRAFSGIGEFNNAINANEKAIAINPKYANAYNYLGVCWYFSGHMGKAIALFNKAIELNPNLSAAYINRAVLWNNKENYEEAVDDYTKAIKIKPDYVRAYQLRGHVFNSIKDFQKAIKDWETAINIDGSFSWLQYDIDRAKAKLGEVIITPGVKQEKEFYFLEELLRPLPDSKFKKELKTKGYNLVDTLDSLRKHTTPNGIFPLAHYTKLKVADIIVAHAKPDEAKMRYYNVVYMNDPEEGKVILEYLKDKKISKAFAEGEKGDENNIYLGSFMEASNVKDKLGHEDDLVMWRTYGKDENSMEAAGCCLVIDANFFDRGKGTIRGDMRSKQDGDEDGTDAADYTEQSLFKVIYYDKRKKQIVDDKKGDITKDMKKLREQLKELISLGEKESREMQSIISSIVYRFLSELRYMVKSADYAFENEYRVIQYKSVRMKEDGKGATENDKVKLDMQSGPPRRLYIESAKPILPHLKKIILGPKVPNPQQWMYLETEMRRKGYDMKLAYSTCKFQ